MAELVFYLFAVMAAVSALMCILQRNPIAAAFWLISAMLALAGIYVLLSAPFIAAIQVLVYAGAVMVLFLFVIMLLNLSRAESDVRGRMSWAVAVAVGTGLMASLWGLSRYTPARLALELTGSAALPPAEVFQAGQAGIRAAQTQGVVGAVAGPLFQSYMIPFQITGVLLLVAIIGAVVLAKRRL